MFFVTGLPRSRTYWLSCYLTTAKTYCYHDLLATCFSRDEFYRKMEIVNYNTGCSDSGLWITDFQQRWPDAPTLIVQRDPGEVHESLDRLGVIGAQAYLAQQSECMRSIHGMRVSYNNLDASMRTIHEYLIPEVPYCKRRAREFSKMRLESPAARGDIAAVVPWIEAIL